MGATAKRVQRSEVAEQPNSHQYLTFTVAGEMYAIGILNIREIIEYANVTPVPMMPTFIRGVINLRGSVVPVIDLAARFGHEASDVSRRTCIVILEIGHEDEQHELGIIVDSVSEVLEVADAEIEAAPSFGARIRTDFIAGMAEIAQRFVILLDAARVLAVDEMASLVGLAQGERGAMEGEGVSPEQG